MPIREVPVVLGVDGQVLADCQTHVGTSLDAQIDLLALQTQAQVTDRVVDHVQAVEVDLLGREVHLSFSEDTEVSSREQVPTRDDRRRSIREPVVGHTDPRTRPPPVGDLETGASVQETDRLHLGSNEDRPVDTNSQLLADYGVSASRNDHLGTDLRMGGGGNEQGTENEQDGDETLHEILQICVLLSVSMNTLSQF